MKRIGILVLSAVVYVLVLYGCGNRQERLSPELDDAVNARLVPLYAGKQYDSLAIVLRVLLNEAYEISDTGRIITLSIHLAQSYLSMGQKDSAVEMLNRLSMPLREKAGPMRSVIDFIEGDLALKYDSDYSTALEHYRKGYINSKYYGDSYGLGVALSNMVYIFYILNDGYGMRYAQELYRLSMLDRVDYFTQQNAYIALAQMYYVAENPMESYKFLCKADSVSNAHDIHFYSALVSLIYGDVYGASGRYLKADSCYIAAMEQAHDGETLLIPLIYLSHGKLFFRNGNFVKAVNLFKSGVEATYQYANVEVRHKLLQQLADLYYDAGMTDSSLVYYMQLRKENRTLPQSIPEADLNSLLLEFQQVEYEHEIQSRELALARANQRVAVLVSLAVVAVVLFLSVWMMYRRKQKMYKTLVMQYENMLSRPLVRSQSVDGLKTDRTDAEKELFARIEDYMVTEKAWRRKDLSLDTMADHFGTNRTYISNAINRAGKMTFASYVNMYRIREAAEVISKDSSVLLKQLADTVGFTSPTLFTKAFCSETGVTPTQYKKTISSVRDS